MKLHYRHKTKQRAIRVRSAKTGREYILHARECVSRNGNPVVLMYFRRKHDPARSLSRIPDGWVVGENKNGLPFLRREQPVLKQT